MKKVLLLYGGMSTEHDVSLSSAKSILDNYDTNLFEITPVYIDKNNNWCLNNSKIDNIISFLKEFDIVFPIIHGYGGEDGKLAGLLDMFDIKYVGSGVLSSAIGMDKEIAKIIFNYLNIPTVPSYTIRNLKDIKKMPFSYPVIVKPANGGSSVGISKVNNKNELKEKVMEAFKYDNKVLIEKYIKARELECAILKYKKLIVSDIGEIKSENELYDYEAKYIKKSNTIVPANIPKNIKKIIQEYSRRVFDFLDCKNLCRIDFFYNEENDKIYLNEINTLPGFTEISMYPKLMINEKISYKNLITYLLQE